MIDIMMISALERINQTTQKIFGKSVGYLFADKGNKDQTTVLAKTHSLQKETQKTHAAPLCRTALCSYQATPQNGNKLSRRVAGESDQYDTSCLWIQSQEDLQQVQESIQKDISWTFLCFLGSIYFLKR
ncbi:hypothetical protein [Hydrogenimonas sp.]